MFLIGSLRHSVAIAIPGLRDYLALAAASGLREVFIAKFQRAGAVWGCSLSLTTFRRA